MLPSHPGFFATALALAVQSYRDARRPVLAVGGSPAAVTRLRTNLGVQTHSSTDLACKLRPPGHWTCVKTGLLRGRGNPHERLAHSLLPSERVTRFRPWDETPAPPRSHARHR